MIKEITDYDFLKKFLWDDRELFDRISDDYTDISAWNPIVMRWFGYFDGDECRGILSVHPESSVVFIIHIHIPKKHRGKDSIKIGSQLLKYVEQNSDEKYVKINAKIPVIYQDVARFAEKNGFEFEGIDRKSYRKNGEYYNRIIYGKIIR
jgi:RimJ/RimL family protein N-acetyltransferase